MDTLLLGITVVSLIVALVMSVTAWRLMREEKQRSTARIAALSAAANDEPVRSAAPPAVPVMAAPPVERVARTPWKPAPFDSSESGETPDSVSLRMDSAKSAESTLSTGFLGSTQMDRSSGSRQRGLAIATVVFFIVITGGFIYTMSGSDAEPAAAAAATGAPLELVSLSHARRDARLAVSGLVRNPVAGKPVEKLSAVVFLFDRAGTFVTSARAQVDFLKLGAGDESPFVISIDAPTTVARYRVSFRTDDGVVPHIDRRGESPAPGEAEQPLNVSMK
jgi:heme exporter protein D